MSVRGLQVQRNSTDASPIDNARNNCRSLSNTKMMKGTHRKSLYRYSRLDQINEREGTGRRQLPYVLISARLVKNIRREMKRAPDE